MVKELYIRNYALIDELKVEFTPGLNILTGETGAGKSIVVGALSMLLGERADPTTIRAEAQYAEVAGVFEPRLGEGDSKLLKAGEACGIDLREGLIIQRRIDRSGRSHIRLNGVPAPLSSLRQIGEYLVDVHGQHEHQSLLKVELHLELLDEFAGLRGLREEVGELYTRSQRLKRELSELEADLMQRKERRELYQFQISEIEGAGLEPNEEERLHLEKGLLETAERRYLCCEGLKEILSEREGSVSTLLAQAEARLSELSGLDPSLKEGLASLKEASARIEEIWRQIIGYQERIEFSAERLEEVNQRLWQLDRLKRKYGRSILEILEYKERIREELSALEIDESRLEELNRELSQVRRELEVRAEELSTLRAREKGRLEKLMEAELSELGMAQARFEVVFLRRNQIHSQGWDEVEFCFSANPGEPPRPLRRIASGGELSRIMLVLKGVLGQVDRIPVLIFDEIDVGIGGRVAEVVGRKLSQLAGLRQVICITHLPQIAKYAQNHILVVKEVEGGRTYTRLKPLKGEERVRELARMLGGEEITETTLRHARELLEDLRDSNSKGEGQG